MGGDRSNHRKCGLANLPVVGQVVAPADDPQVAESRHHWRTMRDHFRWFAKGALGDHGEAWIVVGVRRHRDRQQPRRDALDLLPVHRVHVDDDDIGGLHAVTEHGVDSGAALGAVTDDDGVVLQV